MSNSRNAVVESPVLLVATAAAATAVTGIVIWAGLSQDRRQRRGLDMDDINNDKNKDCVSSCYEELIGNTPMVRLETLSHLLRRSIYVKMECMNPGGTGKDRAAWSMIQAAEQSQNLPPPRRIQNAKVDKRYHVQSHGAELQDVTSSTAGEQPFSESKVEAMQRRGKDDNLNYDETILAAGRVSKTGGIVVEGTSGSTGISLAILSASRGHGCIVVLPDDQASEKRLILQSLGAQVHVVPTASISNPNHYVNIARRIAERAREAWGYNAVFIDQFENTANFQIHYHETGPEIFKACSNLDAFVMSSGTGGTLTGVGKYLKDQSEGHVQVVLVDPPGSSLYNRIQHGVAYATQQAEQRLKRHRYDTLAEGIGLDRITRNFALGESYVDKAIRVDDQQAVDMAHWLLAFEGLFVGSSSSMNIVGAVQTAMSLPEGSNVVTVVCDTGQRHITRFWNREFCLSRGLIWPSDCAERIPQCLQDFAD